MTTNNIEQQAMEFWFAQRKLFPNTVELLAEFGKYLLTTVSSPQPDSKEIDQILDDLAPLSNRNKENPTPEDVEWWDRWDLMQEDKREWIRTGYLASQTKQSSEAMSEQTGEGVCGHCEGSGREKIFDGTITCTECHGTGKLPAGTPPPRTSPASSRG